MSSFKMIDPRRLWVSYVIALALLFSLITFSHFAAVIVGGDGVRAAADINMSGRQRTLSQRILYYSSRHVSANYGDPNIEAALRDAVAQFAASHETLTSQEERPLPSTLLEIYFSEDGPKLDRYSLLLVTDARRILDGWVNDRTTALERMADYGSGTLLSDLNMAVDAFEAHAVKLKKNTEKLALIGYLLAVIALVLVGVFIFRPAHKTIVQAIDDLEANNEQLKQQEAEAFAALEDSEDAWAEAEEARKNSEEVVANAHKKAHAMRNALDLPLGTIERLIARFSAGSLGPEQRQSLVDISRCNMVARETVEEFSNRMNDGSLVENMPDKQFYPLDLAKTAITSVALVHGSDGVRSRLEMGNESGLKITGNPVTTLRLLMDVLQYAIVNLGCQDIALTLSTRACDDGIAVKFWVEGIGPEDQTHAPVLCIDRQITDLQRQSNTEISENRDEKGVVTICCAWTAKSATIRNVRKKARTRKTA